MFKPANPNSRIPAALQAHTKENFVAQIAVSVTFIVVMYAVESYKDRKFYRQLKQEQEQSNN